MENMASQARSVLSSTGNDLPSSLSFQGYIDADARRQTRRQRNVRPRTSRPKTAISTLGHTESQQIVCAMSESRGVSPTVGLAFVDLETSQIVLCQICDSQTYVRTVQKLHVYRPSQLLIMNTAVNPKSKLISIVEENLEDLNCDAVILDRRYWAENAGFDYIQNLAFAEDVEAIKIAIAGSYFAVCCVAAALKYIECETNQTFAYHSLRIKYEPSQGSMMIDISTVCSLELIQNLRDPKSKDCLFGVLNETQSPMGARLLKNNILQPLTNAETLNVRYDALEELTTREEMFFGVRQALKSFLDADRLLTALIMVPMNPSLDSIAQDVNNIIMLRTFIGSIKPVYEALTGAQSGLLPEIRELCSPRNFQPVQSLIDAVVNEDVKYSKTPLDLRNQRVFAIKTGVHGLLDVTRQTFKENSDDVFAYVTELGTTHNLRLELKYDEIRQYFIRTSHADLEEKEGPLPSEFINLVRKKKMVEFSTLELLKRNQKIIDSHQETMLLSSQIVSDLILEVRNHASAMFRISESIAMLDMLSAFAQLVTSQDYVRPLLSDTLAIKLGRHPIKEKILRAKYVPNDVYASQQSRFQIITGCNMSGKSTYIRSVALMCVMAQIGSFVPAQYAAVPIHQQLFARVSVDDSVVGNVSTFAAEMQEAAFILRNIDKHSLAIIDELGRGTSTRDGLAIAIAIAEALVDSRALVWFATHFVDLAKILSERSGVVSLHLAVDMPTPTSLSMLYKLSPGPTNTPSYGLTLARVFPLPPAVLNHAAQVSESLKDSLTRQRGSSHAAMVQKRRKLVLGVREHLKQARDGNMQGEVLKEWLTMLRTSFLERMVRLELHADNDVGSDKGLNVRTDEGDSGRAADLDVDIRLANVDTAADENDKGVAVEVDPVVDLGLRRGAEAGAGRDIQVNIGMPVVYGDEDVDSDGKTSQGMTDRYNERRCAVHHPTGGFVDHKRTSTPRTALSIDTAASSDLLID